MALGSKRSKCPMCEPQNSLISLHLKIESIIAGPLDRLHRRGEEVENKRRGSSLRKNEAIYDNISNVCHLFTSRMWK